MSIAYSTTVRNARLTAVLSALDGGAGAGKVRIYSGTRPATGGTATTLLAELPLSDPAGSVTGGVLTLDAITDDASADNSGTATWARLLDSADTFVADIDVSESGGGGDLILDDTAIVATGTVSIDTFTITEGNP